MLDLKQNMKEINWKTWPKVHKVDKTDDRQNPIWNNFLNEKGARSNHRSKRQTNNYPPSIYHCQGHKV